MNPVIQKIVEMFKFRGESMYAGEPVTQTEHALQAAHLAEQSRAPSSMVAAALVHDVGHLLHNFDEDCAEQGIDDHHEVLASRWLEKHFPAEVCEPVRLHVMAKRYRCAVDAEYHAQLSPASVTSLQLQGGPLTDEEAAEFRQHPFFEQALELRGWDEAAKVPDLATPPLEHFLSLVEESLR